MARSHQRVGFLFVVCVIAACTSCSLIPLLLVKSPPRGVQTYNDPFEGPTRGFVLYLDRSQLTAVGATETRAGVELRVMVVANGDFRAIAPAGTNIDLRIGNETRTVTSTSDAAPVANVFRRQVITQWQVTSILTPDQAAWLIDAPVEVIRVKIMDSSYVLTLSPGDARQVQENMRTLSTPAR